MKLTSLDSLSFPGNRFMYTSTHLSLKITKEITLKTREGFLRKNIVAVSFFQNCAIHPYSSYISFPLNEIIQA